jgi:hypothetical protein
VSRRGPARRLEQVFDEDLTPSREIRQDEWSRRGFGQGAKGRVCAAIAQVS